MLENVFFISVEGKKDYTIGNFLLREDIPLPVYVEDEKRITLEDINPENVIFGMIKVLIEEPDNDNIDYYRDFIFAVQPDIEKRLINIAENAEHNEHYDEAIEMYRVLNLLNNDSNDYILNIAICYDNYSNFMFSSGRDSEAEKLEDEAYKYFKIIEDLREKNEDMLYHLAKFYLIRENYEKAVEHLREYINISTDSQKKDEVIRVLQDISRDGLNDEDYLTAKAVIQSDRYEEAFEFIEKYMKKYPDSWSSHFIKGIALRKTGRLTEAIASFETALNLNPESGDSYNELGLCYMDLKIFHKSELYFYKALKRNPDDLVILHNLAVCSYKRGDIAEAIKYCDIILDWNPADLETKKLKKIILEEKNID